MQCSLCGMHFTKDQVQTICANCVMARTCNLIRCPNCGFEMPTESKLGSLIRKLRGK